MMCLECGCAEVDEVKIDGKPMKHRRDRGHSHGDCGHRHDRDKKEQKTGSAREIDVKRNILDKNNQTARHNREHLKAQGVFTMNLISAPGSGKTAILEKLISDYGAEFPVYVIEGDQQTDNDAKRIKAAGADALQINTGAACHLDAEMIHRALHKIDLKDRKFLIIENVGNMVCPTAYDLGEDLKVAIVSCPEGEDKPVKYPDLMLTADVLLVNKIDLIPYLDFNLRTCIELSKKVNPQITVFPVSAKTGEGLDLFATWLKQKAGLSSCLRISPI